MNEIIEASQLPQNEKIYLKKDFLGWRIVYPIFEDGKINWVNFLVGGWRNLIALILILLFVFSTFAFYQLQIKHFESYCKEVIENPIKFCKNTLHFYSPIESKNVVPET